MYNSMEFQGYQCNSSELQKHIRSHLAQRLKGHNEAPMKSFSHSPPARRRIRPNRRSWSCPPPGARSRRLLYWTVDVDQLREVKERLERRKRRRQRELEEIDDWNAAFTPWILAMREVIRGHEEMGQREQEVRMHEDEESARDAAYRQKKWEEGEKMVEEMLE